MSITIHHGDSREVLKTLADASIDSVVCDPPYALVSIGKRFGAENAAPAKAGKTGAYQRASAGFMGKTWDTGETAFAVEFWAEVYRVLKPGGWVVAFGAGRAVHQLAYAIEGAGFEVRDRLVELIACDTHVAAFLNSLTEEQQGAFLRCVEDSQFGGDLAWVFGSGFPKSHDVSKGIDKAAGARREVVGFDAAKAAQQTPKTATGTLGDFAGNTGNITAPATPEAAQWSGWGTALKPACEPIVLARKPLESTVAANVLAHGTGALNIDGCRVGDGEGVVTFERQAGDRARDQYRTGTVGAVSDSGKGRWPANVLHDGSDEVVEAFPQSANGHWSGETPSLAGKQRQTGADERHEVAASAARFFYTAKADATDRLGSKHPTIKPTDLMRWLCRLVTPPGGVILDPFAGSGSTGVAAIGEGFDAILIEREAEYVADIRRRIAWAQGEGRLTAQEKAKKPDLGLEGLSLFDGFGE